MLIDVLKVFVSSSKDDQSLPLIELSSYPSASTKDSVPVGATIVSDPKSKDGELSEHGEDAVLESSNPPTTRPILKPIKGSYIKCTCCTLSKLQPAA